MDEQERKRRQLEGIQLRKEIGDHEYKKLKAAKRKEYYNKMQDRAKEVLAEEYQPIQVMLPEKKIKPHLCAITVMVIDDTGEHSHTWEAPNLIGTVMASHRNRDGYMSKFKPLLETIVGKLK